MPRLGTSAKSATKKVRRGRKPKAAANGRAEELVSAAFDLFAEQNFATVTIKDIGNAVGANTALIYYYFDSKEDLLRAAIESAVNRAFEHFQELRIRHDNPADIINDWLDNHVDLHEPIQKLVKVSLDYAGLPVKLPRVDRAIRRFYDEESKMLATCIRDGIERGLFDPVDPKQTAQFISTQLDGLMVRSKIFPRLKLHQSVDELKRILWTSLGYRSRS